MAERLRRMGDGSGNDERDGQMKWMTSVVVLLGYPAALLAVNEPSTQPSPEAYRLFAAQVDENLQKEILDKFFPVAVDEQGGGFYENFGLDWKRGATGGKSIVYQSRLTWTSAKADQRFPEKAEMYRAMTRRGAACLANQMWDSEQGGFFWNIGPNDKPIYKTKQMYGHA